MLVTVVMMEEMNQHGEGVYRNDQVGMKQEIDTKDEGGRVNGDNR